MEEVKQKPDVVRFLTYHVGAGWSVARLADGSVRIWQDNVEAGVGLTVPAEVWASMVSHVSAFGETGESFRKALDFHGGKS